MNTLGKRFAWHTFTKAWRITITFDHRTTGDVDVFDLNRKWRTGKMWWYLARRNWERIE